ncbi:MAG TPA: DNA polymerase ligase N-terminal domain-containing protein [Gemmatimonadales bacterium]|nr:DNA polymerase ligase N-terminal domain-containing protein [Gemmatimonadales bacterium]
MPVKKQAGKEKAAKKAPRKSAKNSGKGSPKTAAAKSAAPRIPKRALPKSSLAEYEAKRDFSRTGEPRGGKAAASKKLRYVIQKHAASRLHYDLRLELDGVMKSWAVPKGPSLDPAVRRLAMQVEDHPIEYNNFEGTIPEGEYGGGTVMLWDRGTYEYGGTMPGDPFAALRAAYAKGDFKFILHGDRLKGSWVLVRTRPDERGKAQWLLIKHRDEFAEEGAEDEARATTSVATGRTMEEIAEGDDVWRSNR